jgi:hypothetical protein
MKEAKSGWRERLCFEAPDGIVRPPRLDDLHLRRGDQPLDGRRLTRLPVRAVALVRVVTFR